VALTVIVVLAVLYTQLGGSGSKFLVSARVNDVYVDMELDSGGKALQFL